MEDFKWYNEMPKKHWLFWAFFMVFVPVQLHVLYAVIFIL